MALIDRIAQTHPDQTKHLAAHTMSAVLYLYSIGSATRAQIISGLGLDTEDEPQLDMVLTHIDGLTANQKLAFHGKIEALNILLQEGLITKAQYKNLLDIT